MNKQFQNILKSLSGVVIAVFFLVITFRNKPLGEIFGSIAQSNVWYLFLSGICLLFVTFLRALRWKVLIDNTGTQPKIGNVFLSLLIGYFVNSFTPKFGEIVRCTTLNKTDKVPISRNLGTVVSERIYDVIVLVMGIIAVFLLEADKLYNLFAKVFEKFNGFEGFRNILIVLVLVGVAFFLFLLYVRKRQFKSQFIQRVVNFIDEMVSTVLNTFKIKRYSYFILLTFLIWAILAVMNYFFLLSLPETDNFTFYFAIIILFIGGIGWALPAPGGIGTTHFFILQLFIAFGLNQNAALSFGVLSNGITLLLTILFGFVAWIIHKMRISKLKVEL